jgi:hypothetical protein
MKTFVAAGYSIKALVAAGYSMKGFVAAGFYNSMKVFVAAG